jgi:hypothetical protein
MEILLRWKCPQQHVSDIICSRCQGTGYVEQWVPLDLLKTLQNANWIIVARRATGLSDTSVV